MKKSYQTGACRKTWEGKIESVEILIEEKMMEQMLDEFAEILYDEFSQLPKIKSSQISFPMNGCSSEILQESIT